MGRPDLSGGRQMDPAADGPPARRARAPESPISGAIVFVLDAVRIAQKATFGVVSGSTGYAWIINPEGILFDHYEADFIGRSIFEVRKARNPKLSYKVIDDLTRGQLLQKKGGHGPIPQRLASQPVDPDSKN